MVESAELVAGDNQDITVEVEDEIANGIAFAEWDKKAAGALDEQVNLGFML